MLSNLNPIVPGPTVQSTLNPIVPGPRVQSTRNLIVPGPRVQSTLNSISSIRSVRRVKIKVHFILSIYVLELLYTNNKITELEQRRRSVRQHCIYYTLCLQLPSISLYLDLE